MELTRVVSRARSGGIASAIIDALFFVKLKTALMTSRMPAISSVGCHLWGHGSPTSDCVDAENCVVSLKHLNPECTKPSPGNLGGETGLASCAQRSKTAAALPLAAVHSTLYYPLKTLLLPFPQDARRGQPASLALQPFHPEQLRSYRTLSPWIEQLKNLRIHDLRRGRGKLEKRGTHAVAVLLEPSSLLRHDAT